MHRSVLILVGLALPWSASAECCRLVKLESTPSSTQVRVCDAAQGADCASPLFAGDVAYGAPHEVCAEGDRVVYRELDPALGAFGAPIEARCETDLDVEL